MEGLPMKMVSMPRASVFGLCVTLGAFAARCMTDGDLDGTEASVSSEITLDPTASYSLIGVQSGRCVGPVGGSTASNVRLEIQTCNSTAIQRWRPQPGGGGFCRMHNELSGLCIDVSGASLALGAAVIQFTCNTGTNQQWSVADVAGGSERLTVRHSGQVLDVTGQGTAAGTLIDQWSSNNGGNQHFTMPEALPAIVAP